MALYLFKRTRQPQPGTGEYAFQMKFGLPTFVVGGPGEWNRRQLGPLQPAQTYHLHNEPTSSVVDGGLAAGQIFGQPLLNRE